MGAKEAMWRFNLAAVDSCTVRRRTQLIEIDL
jgi:hypothetical protein